MTQIVEMQAQGDIKQVNKLKNIISAYESRVGKQAKQAIIENQVTIREQQLTAVMQVLKRQLAPERLRRIASCIEKETPESEFLTNLIF